MPEIQEACCSYCNKNIQKLGQDSVVCSLPILVGEESTRSYICQECVRQFASFFANRSNESTSNDNEDDFCDDEDDDDNDQTMLNLAGAVPNAKEIINDLDEAVIGQSQAKKVLSVAVVNHYKRILQEEVGGQWVLPYQDVEIDKSNILLIGPTGCGKTELARTLAKKMGVPFAIGDATTLTEAGYVGEDVENLLLKLLYAADFDLKAAEHGIIYIDEIDKIGSTKGNVSLTRDVSGEGVQQSLLKMLEGTVANVPPGGGRKHPEQQYIRMDTSNILFICGGTFVGLEDIIAKRINRSKIGFGNKDDVDLTEEERTKDIMRHLTTKDLVDYGLIPELIGRLPVHCTLNELSEADMVRVLTEPKNSIVKQYQKIFAMSRAHLRFQDEALLEIARCAKELKTGARALRAIMEALLLDAQVELSPASEGISFIITPGFVRGEESLFTQAEAA